MKKTGNSELNQLMNEYDAIPVAQRNVGKKVFAGWDEMKMIFANEVEQWQLAQQTPAQAKNGTLPPLKPLAGARILAQHFYTCVFSENEAERLAVYLPEQGIYTQNYGYIKRIIDALYAPFNERQAENVIYHLKNWAPSMQPTSDRYLIPVANGVFNLHTHRLESFSHEYVFTTKITTKYVNNPVPPNINGWTFDSWLNDIACNDKEITTLLWQVINDSLNGNYTRKKAIFLYSENGSSGKGTFQRLIQNLVGANNIGSLKVNQFDERFKLAMLAGKTVCIGDDIPPDVYIKDSSNFNSVVTGDPVTIEFKGRDGYTATLRCTVIQSCNGLPNFHNKGGTMRRIVIVPFNNQFTGSSDNWKIKDDYLARQDVLEYVLYRALQLNFERFSIPKSSIQALKEFEQDNDPLVGFKESFFDQQEVTKIPTYYLYSFYKQYCKDNSFRPIGQAKFTRRFILLLNGYEKKPAKFTVAELNQLKKLTEQDEIINYERFPESGKKYNSIKKTAKK